MTRQVFTGSPRINPRAESRRRTKAFAERAAAVHQDLVDALQAARGAIELGMDRCDLKTSTLAEIDAALEKARLC